MSEKMKIERYIRIWTHFCNDPSVKKPWTAMLLENKDENPIEKLASYGEHSGATYGDTELEAIAELFIDQYSEQIADLQKQNAALQAKYQELIMQVVRKFPDETRHETVLRYIKNAESVENEPEQS